MAATLELKYFNSYWLKKIKTITDVVDGTATYVSNNTTSFVVSNISPASNVLKTGQKVSFSYTDGGGNPQTYNGWIVSVTNATTFVANVAPNPAVTGTPTINFGPITNFDNIPADYSNTNADDWYIEEARIRGGYNNTITDLGVKAHIVEDNPNNQNRFNTLIYSGVFNSRTGVNQTNEFSVGEDITRSVDPAKGSIQKLYAEDTNLIIFQEDKVNRALIDKDAIYTAEGNPAVTSSNVVIGQIVPYQGEYGISTDPTSFAIYGYRKYFTDRKRGCVLRLSSGGEIVEISSYGMHDFFRDQLTATDLSKIVGGWDMHTKNYILSIQKAGGSYETLSFDESVQGWTSRLSYKPSHIFSLASTFFTTNTGKLYQHYVSNTYNQFYGVTHDSTVTVVLNNDPSTIKVFQTLNYEGSEDWYADSILASSGDIGQTPITKYSTANSLSALSAQLLSNTFKKKENKFFANIYNSSVRTPGEIVFGKDMTGIKGFFTTVKFVLDKDINKKRELFAVSSETVESSY